MSAIIAHRGFWWPRRDLQNHASSIYSALSAGWGAEVDVWGVYGMGLRVGHDAPAGTFTPPDNAKPGHGNGFLFLHLKTAGQGAAVCEVLRNRRWLDLTHVFYSPSNDGALDAFFHEKPIPTQGPKRLMTVDNPAALAMLLDLPDPLGGADGVWLEQPESDWADETTIASVHAVGKTAYVTSSELHGRQLDLGIMSQWMTSDGVCTDFPHLVERVMDPTDKVMHPKEPWWF